MVCVVNVREHLALEVLSKRVIMPFGYVLSTGGAGADECDRRRPSPAAFGSPREPFTQEFSAHTSGRVK
jgi:hypothetical protein